MKRPARWAVAGFLMVTSCAWLPFGTQGSAPHPAPALPPIPTTWQTALDDSTLPTLQTNLGGDTDRDWRYANAALGAEVWIEATDGGTGDAFVDQPSLLDVPLTDTGWPQQLSANEEVTLSPSYFKMTDPAPGALRSGTTETLTGLYVVTWKGQTLPDGQGQSQFHVLDTINDSWGSTPDRSQKTIIVPAGDHRVLALVQGTGRGVNVRYRSPDPADPIRDIKIWTPVDMGSGLGLAASLGAYSAASQQFVPTYDASTMAAGLFSSYCTEPAPGQPDPLWHPKYLEHLRSDPSGVVRFMGWEKINGLGSSEPSLDWGDRLPATYTVTSLVAIDPSNYTRHALATFPGRTGVPYEWMFDLCNLVHKDAWLQVPHSATPAHIAGLGTLAAQKLGPDRRVWFEFSNELWNTYGPYLPQHDAAAAEGAAAGQTQGWGSGHLQGRALKTFEDAWYRAGGSDDRLINVVGGWAGSSDYNNQVLQGVEAVGPSLAEVLAATTYFGYELTDKLYGLAYGDGNPGPEIYQQAKQALRGSIYQDYEAWQANAATAHAHGVGMVAYEGGSHVLATGHGDWNNPANAAFMTFLANLHKHPVMEDLYQEHWALWCAAGGRTASLFTDIGGYGYFGYWGAKEDVTETASSSPRWDAAQKFVATQAGVRALGSPLGTAPSLSAVRAFRGEVGQAFHETISASGGEGTLNLTILGGGPAEGTSFTPNGGSATVSGTPTALEIARFVVRVTDQDGDPDYGVFTATVDPAGTSSGSLLLFDPAALPAASLAASETNEAYRTRFDDARPATPGTDSLGNPRRSVAFDPVAPLYTHHYTVAGLVLDPQGPFAPSGGWTFTVRKTDLDAAHAALWDAQAPAQNQVAWFGLRGQSLAGWTGDSLTAGGQTFGVPTTFEALLVWRKDQLGLAAGQKAGFGAGSSQASLVLEFGGTGAGSVDLRFVVRAKDPSGTPRYYLSEASWSDPSAGRFTVTDFQAQSAVGLRWAPFDPGSTFVLPDPAMLTFAATDLSDLDGVGFAVRTKATGWHYGLEIKRFLAVGTKR